MIRLFGARFRNRLLRWRLKKKDLNQFAELNLHAIDLLGVRRPARDNNFVVISIQTTGLDLNDDRILRIGALRMQYGRIRLDRIFNQYVNPNRKIPPEAIKFHGIVPGMIENAASGRIVIDEFIDYIGDSILVAHNAPFHLSFLNLLMKARHGFGLQNLVLDTVPLSSRFLMPKTLTAGDSNQRASGDETPEAIVNSPTFSVDDIVAHLGLNVYQRHTALGDALTVAMIFQRILSKIETEGDGKLRSLLKSGGAYSTCL